MTFQARIPETEAEAKPKQKHAVVGSFSQVTIVLPEDASDSSGQVLADLLQAANEVIPEAQYGVTTLRLSDLNQLRHGRQNRSLCIFLGDLKARWRVTPAERSLVQTLLHHCRAPVLVGGAAFLLRETGMFQGHQLAVHSNFAAAAGEEALETAPAGTQFLSEGPVLSAVSTLAALRLLLQIIARDHGEFMAGALAEYVGLEGGDSRFQSKASLDILQKAGGDILIEKSLHLMQQHIEEPISICELARQQGVSTRKLQRRFRERTGGGPHTAYRTLRIERAHQLLTHTSMNVYEIVAATGFGTRSNLSRWFHKELGLSPQAVRRSAYCEASNAIPKAMMS
ncbi:transcriptional regulator, AraC family protein [Roseobacter sp. SK209-2-6]|uniref:helix-turn-helix domain-containing protein n=1 Tax=Roseobacter sp. SK209-2-6 TaxID=388739 RepID=UPI0000F3F3F6|nr:helix-turn-helix domain-containing protein [Roseobacter sp. SK209-2-6]EBA14619.1 transcriptional regulator, AraC family protein [Roseobacter sp. SK209-2-6]